MKVLLKFGYWELFTIKSQSEDGYILYNNSGGMFFMNTEQIKIIVNQNASVETLQKTHPEYFL